MLLGIIPADIKSPVGRPIHGGYLEYPPEYLKLHVHVSCIGYVSYLTIFR